MKITYGKIEQRDSENLAKMIRNVFIEHDAPKEGTVYSDPTTDNLYALFQYPESILHVVRVNDIAVGCCGIFPTAGLPDGCVELVKFYLEKEYRESGIGLNLFGMSIESAREFGYKSIYLESLPHYAKAVNMYEKNGFYYIKSPLGNSGHTTCNIWMVKDLY